MLLVFVFNLIEFIEEDKSLIFIDSIYDHLRGRLKPGHINVMVHQDSEIV